MGRKPNLPRNSKKAPRRTRAVITAQLRIDVLKEFHVNRLTITNICQRHSCCYETVRKILDTTEYKPENFRSFNPGDVYKRIDLPPIDRLKLLSSDAAQILELTLAGMIFKLQRELNQTENNVDKTATLSVKELTMFFAEAAPYVLQKAKSVIKSGGDMQSPLAKVHNMFKPR